GDERLGMPPLHFGHPGSNGVARKAASYEDDEAVQASDTIPAEREAVDGEFQLLILGNGRGHCGTRVCTRPPRGAVPREAGPRSNLDRGAVQQRLRSSSRPPGQSFACSDADRRATAEECDRL